MRFTSLVTSLLLSTTSASNEISVLELSCSDITIGSSKYDISNLKGLHSFSTNRPSPPSTIKSTINLSLCGDLLKSNPNSEEGCSVDSRICLKNSLEKEGTTSRIISIIPFLEVQKVSELEKNWVLEIGGGSWNEISQSAKIEMICDQSSIDTVPTYTSYDSLKGELNLKWISKSACAIDPSSTPPPKDDKSPPSQDDSNKSSSMGAFSWFFLILLISFLSYLVIGSYQNYVRYGSVGLDALPHRDLWRDLPFLIKDLFSSRRSGGGGYTSLG